MTWLFWTLYVPSVIGLCASAWLGTALYRLWRFWLRRRRTLREFSAMPRAIYFHGRDGIYVDDGVTRTRLDAAARIGRRD